jgi:hypothetical protein
MSGFICRRALRGVHGGEEVTLEHLAPPSQREAKLPEVWLELFLGQSARQSVSLGDPNALCRLKEGLPAVRPKDRAIDVWLEELLSGQSVSLGDPNGLRLSPGLPAVRPNDRASVVVRACTLRDLGGRILSELEDRAVAVVSNAARVGDDDESRVLLPVSARGGAFRDFAGAHIPQAYRIVRAAGRDLVKRLGAWECGWGPRNSRVAVQTYGPRLVLPASALNFDPAMTAHVRARVHNFLAVSH